MDSKSARQIAWSPPPTLLIPQPAKVSETEAEENAGEPGEEEGLDTTLAELLAAAECDMGCDWPEGPLSSDGCRW